MATKSKHKHEYIRPFARMYVRSLDGSLSEEKRHFYLKVHCALCHKVSKTTKARKDALEFEVTPTAFKSMKNGYPLPDPASHGMSLRGDFYAE